jgi:hypothetical protein
VVNLLTTIFYWGEDMTNIDLEIFIYELFENENLNTESKVLEYAEQLHEIIEYTADEYISDNNLIESMEEVL